LEKDEEKELNLIKEKNLNFNKEVEAVTSSVIEGAVVREQVDAVVEKIFESAAVAAAAESSRMLECCGEQRSNGSSKDKEDASTAVAREELQDESINKPCSRKASKATTVGGADEDLSVSASASPLEEITEAGGGKSDDGKKNVIDELNHEPFDVEEENQNQELAARTSTSSSITSSASKTNSSGEDDMNMPKTPAVIFCPTPDGFEMVNVSEYLAKPGSENKPL
ncbi:unnamed protein product, partial [Amoebophrya sp. A120]